MYIHLIVDMPIHDDHPSNPLFALPCACQNLRRVTRLVTRIYNQELRNAGIESSVEQAAEDDAVNVLVPEAKLETAQDAIEALTEPDDLISEP